MEDLNELDNFVSFFDESYNKIVKKGQMDLHKQFWKEESNTVCTRYYTSDFMGKDAAPDILRPFCLCSMKSVRLMNQVLSSTLSLVVCILSKDRYKRVPKPEIGNCYYLQCTRYFTNVHQEPVMNEWL